MKKMLFWLLVPLLAFATTPSTIKVVKTERSVENTITPTEPIKVNNVYQIGTASELLWFRNHTNKSKDNLGANAILTADIDLEAEEWIPIAAGDGNMVYSGTFNGNGHTISNYVLNTDSLYNYYYSEQGMDAVTAHHMIQNSGFIGSCKGTVKNLQLEDVIVISNANGGFGTSTDPSYMEEKAVSVGSVVGWLNGGTVDNVIVSGNLSADGTGVALGGIVGNAGGGKIINSTSSVKIHSDSDTSTVYIGGIVGYTKNKPTLKNDTWNGEIIVNAGHGKSGGIIGRIYSGTVTIENVTYNSDGVSSGVGDIKSGSINGQATPTTSLYSIVDRDGTSTIILHDNVNSYVEKGLFLEQDIGKEVAIEIERSFNIGTNSTITLPFNILLDNVNGAEFCKFDYITYEIVDNKRTYTAYVSPVTSIEANKPYVVIPSEEHITISGTYIIEQTTEESTISTDGNWMMLSSYHKYYGSDLDSAIRVKTYGFAGKAIDDFHIGQFVKMGKKAYIFPYRALLRFIGPETFFAKSTYYQDPVILPESMNVVVLKDTITLHKRLPDNLLNITPVELRTTPKYNRFENKIDIMHKGRMYNTKGQQIRR